MDENSVKDKIEMDENFIKLPKKLKGSVDDTVTISKSDKKVIDVDALFSTIAMIIYIIAVVICLIRPTIASLATLMITGFVHSTSCIANAIRQKKIENISISDINIENIEVV